MTTQIIYCQKCHDYDYFDWHLVSCIYVGTTNWLNLKNLNFQECISLDNYHSAFIHEDDSCFHVMNWYMISKAGYYNIHKPSFNEYKEINEFTSRIERYRAARAWCVTTYWSLNKQNNT